MKKMLIMVLCLALSLLFCLSLTGCTAADSSAVTAWPLATDSPEDAVAHLFAVRFAEETETLSGGKMQIQVYSNGTLGRDIENLESCAAGDIPFVVQTTAPQVDFVPETAVFDLPCAFSSVEQFRMAVEAEPFRSMLDKAYIQNGFHLLGFADQGFRVVTSNRKIQKLNEFSGIKIRTMENKNHIAFWQAVNANPTPMNFGEVYIGLQQGTIAAQENPYETVASGKLYEQQKYLIDTNHIPHLLSLIVSEDFFEKLPAGQQDILTQAAKNAVEYAHTLADERIASRLEIFEEAGVTHLPFSPELHEQMQKASGDVYQDIRKQVGDELVDALMQAAEENRNESE